MSQSVQIDKLIGQSIELSSKLKGLAGLIDSHKPSELLSEAAWLGIGELLWGLSEEAECIYNGLNDLEVKKYEERKS